MSRKMRLEFKLAWFVAAVAIVAGVHPTADGGPRAAREHLTFGELVPSGLGLQPKHEGVGRSTDTDQDGLPDNDDNCPAVIYAPGFDWNDCGCAS